MSLNNLRKFVIKKVEGQVSLETSSLLFTGDIGSTLLIVLLEGKVKNIIVPRLKCFTTELYDTVEEMARKYNMKLNFIECITDSADETKKHVDLMQILLESTIRYMKEHGMKTLITSLSLEENKPYEEDITLLFPLDDVPEPEIKRYISAFNIPHCNTNIYISAFPTDSQKTEEDQDEEVLKRLQSLGYL